MLTNKKRIKQAPVMLCRLLSPLTNQQVASRTLDTLLAQPLLLDKVVECANRHFTIATLHAQLQRHNLSASLPTELNDYLQYQHDFMLARNQRLQKQTQSILTLLNQIDLIPLLMKGGDTLFYDLYPTQGCRFMSDLDILLPVGSVPLAKQQLFAHGYATPGQYQAIEDSPQAHHTAPIYKVGDDCAIELHYKPLNCKSGTRLSPAEAFSDSKKIASIAQSNIKARTLSPVHKVLHCFIHSEISHGYQESDRLAIRQMDYFVRLMNYYREDINWEKFRETLAVYGYTRDFAIYCNKVNRLFGWPDQVPLFTDNNLSENVLEQHYQSALASAMSQYFPLRRFRYGLPFLIKLFSRRWLQGKFGIVIDGPISHVKAIGLQSTNLAKRLIEQPRQLTQQVRDVFTRPW